MKSSLQKAVEVGLNYIKSRPAAIAKWDKEHPDGLYGPRVRKKVKNVELLPLEPYVSRVSRIEKKKALYKGKADQGDKYTRNMEPDR